MKGSALLALVVAPLLADAQSIGIGTSTPDFPLDVNGQMRLRWLSGNEPAGIWLNKSANAGLATAFWGMQNDSTIGVLSNASSTWVQRINTENGNVLLGAFVAGKAGSPPPINQGAGMFWYAPKLAFRAGSYNLEGGYTHDNIGSSSFVYGVNSIATHYAVAFGINSMASGVSSFAAGQLAKATNSHAVSLGYETLATGPYSVAVGQSVEARGNSALAAGFGAQALGSYSVALGERTFAKARGSITVGAWNDVDDNPDPLVAFYTDRIFQLGNGSIDSRRNALTVLRDGRVGIGTVNPLALLHLKGGIQIEDGTQAANRVLTADANGLASWKDLPASASLWTSNGNNISNNNSGNVGIGTHSPGALLHIKGSAGEALRLQSEDPFLSFYDNTGAYSGFLWANKKFGNDLRMGTPAASNMPIVLAPNDNVAVMAATSGNVGIGTITPAARLEVVAGPSASATKVVIANKGGFGPAALEFVSDYGLGSQWRPGYIASNDNGSFTGKLEFFTNGSGSGNLYGAVKGLEVRSGATLTATGSVGSFSDARLKNNIEPFTDGLNVIEQINPVQFQYNADAPFATPDKQVGIVAQELEKVAPYMVHQTAEGNAKDMRWVDNQAYVFLLINAVKELRQQVEAQQKEIEKLKRRSRSR